MRLVVLLFCCAVLFQAGCSHTGGAASSNSEMDETPTAKVVTIAAKKGRTYGVVRMTADSKSPILAKLPVGTELKSFGQFEDWYQVQIPDTGQLGWIKNIYLEEKP